MAIIIKSQQDIQAMRESAAINVEALDAVRAAIKPGITTGELDQIAHDIITRRGGKPAFLGHPAGSDNPFPATITVSINEQLVHGIPGARRLEDAS